MKTKTVKSLFKTSFLLLVNLLTVVAVNAQEFSGKAIYKTSKKTDTNFGKSVKMSEAEKEKLIAMMAKANQKTFTLTFNKSESLYKEDVVLSTPNGSNQMKSFSLLGGGSDILYKNITENRITNKKELQGKLFLIKDEMIAYNWKLTGETKNIGSYTCYKAIYEKEIVQQKILENENKENQIITITAWYTPVIPVSNGPENFWGLPGLILEVNDGTNMMICTEIQLNSKKKLQLKEPKRGKVVSLKDFKEIERKKKEEVSKQLRSRNGMMINGSSIKIVN